MQEMIHNSLEDLLTIRVKQVLLFAALQSRIRRVPSGDKQTVSSRVLQTKQKSVDKYGL